MPIDQHNKIGLVLTGGGAKGAYHVGALKALNELGVPIHAVAGASIGALNSAVVAASSNIAAAYKNLDDIWKELAGEQVIKVSNKAPTYFAMMAGMAVAFRAVPVASAGLMAAKKIAEELGFDFPEVEGNVLDETPLVTMLKKYVEPHKLRNGLPLYASVYPSSGGLSDVVNVAKAILRVGNTSNSEYLHVQSLSDTDMQEVLMASAALPILYRAREIQGTKYTDGGQGDWYGVGGNTPVKPLVDANCNTIIVVHLCDGSMWDRSQYPNINIIEIRPRESIARENACSDVLGFDHKRIKSWAEQGYADSMYVLKRVFDVVNLDNSMNVSREKLNASIEEDELADDALSDAMKRIKSLTAVPVKNLNQ